MFTRLKAALLAATLVLAACSDRSEPTDGALRSPETASKATRQVNSASVEPEEDLADLSASPFVEVVRSGELGPVRIDPDELERMEGGLYCSVDSINGKPLAEGRRHPRVLRVSGWVELTEPRHAVFVVLRGSESFAFAAQLRADRPDVAKAVGRADAADLVTRFSASALPAGEYKVYVVRATADGQLTKCLGAGSIHLE